MNIALSILMLAVGFSWRVQDGDQRDAMASAVRLDVWTNKTELVKSQVVVGATNATLDLPTGEFEVTATWISEAEVDESIPSNRVRVLVYSAPILIVGKTNGIPELATAPMEYAAPRKPDSGEWLVQPGFMPRSGTNVVTYEPFLRLGPSTWNGPQDHSLRFRLSHDGFTATLEAEVADDEHDQSKKSSWNGDALQLLVTNPERTVKLLAYACSLTDTGILASIFQGKGPVTTSIQRNEAAKTTFYAVQFPVPGDVFGFAFIVNDGDVLEPGQRGWSGFQPYGLVYEALPAKAAIVTLKP